MFTRIEGGRPPDISAAQFLLRTVVYVVAFAIPTALLVRAFPAHWITIVVSSIFLFISGIGLCVGLEWHEPYMTPEGRAVLKRIGRHGLWVLLATAGYDAIRQWHTFAQMAGLLTLGVAGLVAGFVGAFCVGCRTSRHRNRSRGQSETSTNL